MITFFSTLFNTILATLVGGVMVFIHFFVPIPPTCLLTLHTSGADTQSVQQGTVTLSEGETLTVDWSSMNASSATVNGKADSQLSGTESYTPHATTTYTYTFNTGKNEVSCSVLVNVTPKPVVTVSVPVVTPKPVIQPPKVTPPVVVVPPVTPPVVTPPITPVPSVPLGPTTLVVWNIPLLSGGTVHAGQSVPVSYLQVTNVGKASTVITGFWITQTGSAPASRIIGLSVVDDRGKTQGSVGGSEGSSPFTGYVALASTNTHFEPGQLRLFTIKAKVSSNVSSLVGTTVTLDVTGVQSEATVDGKFPIRGTTWTIAE